MFEKGLPRLLLAGLAAPWIVVAYVCRSLMSAVRHTRAFKRSLLPALNCPSGHANALDGRWVCQCGTTFLGYAFAPCPLCRLPAGSIPCATCGLTIIAPHAHL